MVATHQERNLNEVPSNQNDLLTAEPSAAQLRTSRIKMLLMFAIISAPVIFSYGAYYLHKPVGRSNYGALIEPISLLAMPLRSAAVVQDQGKLTERKADRQAADGDVHATAVPLTAGAIPPAVTEAPHQFKQVRPLQHRWLMVTVGNSACDEICARRLLYVRQVRWTTGVDMERIERVWILTDEATPPATLLAEHQGLHVLRIDRRTLDAYFRADPRSDLADHVWLIDPLGNLMMRFPKDLDPDKMKRDMLKLLRASRIG